jgi:hypothetical protein
MPERIELNEEATRPAEPAKKRRRLSSGRVLLLLILAVVVLDIVAVMLVPPFPKDGQAGQACDFPVCFVTSTIEMPPPAVVLDLQPDTAPNPLPMIYFHPSVSNTILTMWIVMSLILLVGFIATRRMKLVPGRLQKVLEWAYEFGSDL